MLMFLNTANPLITFSYILIIAAVILISKYSEKKLIIAVLMFLIIAVLVCHSITLENISSSDPIMVSRIYHCLVIDLIFLLVTFVSYLWVDDINAKKKQLKSYDDSLSWFWNKL